MSENMTDLEWLARRVHKWTPDDPNHKLRLHKADALNAEGWTFAHCYSCGYSFDEWQAERERLQNKPSWDDAPKSAKWVAQDCNGEWWFFDSKPWMVRTGFYCLEGKSSKASSGGEVLGDWSDTLERLPNDDSDSPRCSCGRGDQKIIHNINCEIIKMKWDRDKRELYQQNKSSDASAHIHAREKHNYWRGPEDGLPPVMTKCEVRTGYATEPYSYEECDIIAHFRGASKMCAAYTTVNHDGSVIVGQGTVSAFRPLRTEEDKAVEDMLSIVQSNYVKSRCIFPDTNLSDDNWISYLMALYDAGYRKQDASE